MRLLAQPSNGKLRLTPDLLDKTTIPSYAILSHTWSPNQEVIFEDLDNVQDTTAIEERKSGYRKIDFCVQQAKRDSLHHVWVDTCCIKKQDLVELQTALNSMFRWYRDAVVCYVYLADVSTTVDDSEGTWETAFRKSRWFTRGWTLQELLAPRKLLFFSKEGLYLGNRQTLEQQIHEITGIALPALRGVPLSNFSVEERMSWVADRHTTREEDKAYSLLGLFDIFMPLHYGETAEKAFLRLRRTIEL
jgi:hypothetical protein